MDVNFWRLTPLFHELFRRPRFPAVPVGTVVELVQYGCSSLASEQPIGVPMLRMNNLQNDGWDLSDLKYIQMSVDELARYRLEPGDLLFNRTNSKELVGKCEVFNEPGDWVFASYLIRVRLDSLKSLPRFAADFLSTRAGRLQIDRLSRQIIGMTNINAEELREILLPLPVDTKRQAKLVAAMDAARAKRRAKLAKASALLVGLDGFVLEKLGLNFSLADHRAVDAARLRCFAVRRQKLTGKIDVASHDPNIQLLMDALENGPHPSVELRLLVSAESGIRYGVGSPPPILSPSAETVPFVRATDIKEGEIQTGSLLHIHKEQPPQMAKCLLRAGEVIVVRSGVNTGDCAPVTATLAGAFAAYDLILRLREGSESVLPNYLTSFLGSRLGRGQLNVLKARSAQPHINAEELGSIRVPVPPKPVQTKITTEVTRRREEARRLRAEAESEWQAAKQWFEDQLLGTAQP